MDATIESGNLFPPQNYVKNIKESDYAETGFIIEAVKAVGRITHQCIYIIDYFKRGFLYVSDNIARLCGVDAEKIKASGFRFYTEYVPANDLEMMYRYGRSGFGLFYTFPARERKDYMISCNFHVRRDGQERLINHKLSPLMMTEDGKIWLALCSISFAAGNVPGNIKMKKPAADIFWQYSLQRDEWEQRDEIVLTDEERKMLFLSAQGYMIRDIAVNMCKSADTVKTYRRCIFRKMNVKNIARALIYAHNHCLI